MALFQNPFSLEVPVKIGILNLTFFINENLFVSNAEVVSFPHNHHDYEMRYISAGSCRQMVNSKQYRASRGDLLLVYPFEYHCQSLTPDAQNGEQYNLRFSVCPPSGKENPAYQRTLTNLQLLLEEKRLIHDPNMTLLPYFERLADEIYCRKSGYICNIQSLCTLIFTNLLRLCNEVCNGLYPAMDLKYRGYERTAVDEFFNYRFLGNATVQDLAESMKLSVRQVNRILHKLFGMSFSEKLTEMRLMEAAKRIVSTKDPLLKISQDCGFVSYNTFFRTFRKKFGTTPTEYRNRMKPNTAHLPSDPNRPA